MLNKQFMMGATAAIGLIMMYQDWHGLEGYITLMRLTWVDLHWTVGAAIAVFGTWFGRDLK